MDQTQEKRPEQNTDNSNYSVGAVLREARESLDQNIEEIARTLRINRRYLVALEGDRFRDLPGNVYAIGFIRTYAEYLGLDGDDLVLRYKEASEDGTKKTQLDFPEPIPETGLPGGVILFAGLVVAVIAYGGWYIATEDDDSLTNLVAPVPERLAEEAGAESATKPPVEEATPDPVEQNQTAVESTGQSEIEDEVAESMEADVVVEKTDDQQEIATEAIEEFATAEMNEDAREAVDGVEQSSEELEETVAEDQAGLDTIGEETSEVDAPPELASDEDVAVPDSVEIEDVTEKVVSDVEESAEEVSGDAEALTSDTQSLNEAQLRAVQKSLDAENADEIAGTPQAEAGQSEPEIAEDVNSIEATVEESEEPVEIVASEPRVYGEEGAVRIIITAKSDSWTEVRDTRTDEILLTRLLRAGDSFRVPNREGLVLTTGNAGGLEITVDGIAVPAIGGEGAIRRDVSLATAPLIAGEPAN